jgi:hypothetical protein
VEEENQKDISKVISKVCEEDGVSKDMGRSEWK